MYSFFSPLLITITIYTDMVLVSIIAYILISIAITAIICIFLSQFNIINDENDQKTAFIVILIVVFLLLIIGTDAPFPTAHKFKA